MQTGNKISAISLLWDPYQTQVTKSKQNIKFSDQNMKIMEPQASRFNLGYQIRAIKPELPSHKVSRKSAAREKSNAG